MTKRCSHCSHNGHNSRTCPNRGVKIFGVRLTDGLIRKSASMGNLTHYTGSNSNNHGSPGETPEHDAAADGYASEDFVPSSSSGCRERKKGVAWTEEEHKMFLLGLQKLGKGDWRGIARNYVISRTPTQVASHAQKYFIRQSNVSRRKRRSSLFDMISDESIDTLPVASQELCPVSNSQGGTQSNNLLTAPPAVEEEVSMDSTNTNEGEATILKPESSHCSYPGLNSGIEVSITPKSHPMGQFTSCLVSPPFHIRKPQTKITSSSSNCSHGRSLKLTDFPRDIIFDILSRLPADALIRLRIVCKLWNNLIRDSDFIDLHLSKWMNKPPSHLIVAPYRGYDSTGYLFLVDGIEGDDWSSRHIQVDCLIGKDLLLHGSCNGLICMASALKSDPILICNPITGESMCLSRSNLEDEIIGPGIVYLSYTIGFGFNHSTKKYKVVRLLCYTKNYQHQLLGEEIIFGESSWRKLDIPSWRKLDIPAWRKLDILATDRWYDISPMLFLNGFFYWIGDEFILVFDIGCEKFCTIKLRFLGQEFTPALANIQGSLALVIMHSASNNLWRIVGSMATGFSLEQCASQESKGRLSCEVPKDQLRCEKSLFIPSFVSLNDSY
ncbi:hypothetical protein NE237_012221 [Protea cynaroides]|uniref:Uncharacterized protein n=1 Tax=Protea cynaroides TaxID=273540 RepID=A0A9Q0GX38_9MAGN|nr:hypothetical protein NE237_012221 [Protea cynaroides]